MLDVRDFGAHGDGTDQTAALANAIATAKANGADLYAPSGAYDYDDTLDLIGPSQIRLYGDGPDRTIFTYTGTGTGIAIGSGASGGPCRKSGIQGIYLRQGDGTLRTTAIPGNYGIGTPDAGTGTGIFIRDCAVVGFGEHAIRIAGPTGPTVIEDVEIYRCAGYGIVAANVGAGLVPQDLSIVRGSIQDMWGGIALGTGCTSTAVYDTDIELGTAAKYPALEIGVGGGHSFNNVTCSAGATLNAAALVYCEGFGNVWTGGLFFAPDGVDNFWFNGSNANRNTVIGGHHSGTTGYFARVHSGVQNSFISPDLKPGYSAGRGLVYNMSGASNQTFAVGVAQT